MWVKKIIPLKIPPGGQGHILAQGLLATHIHTWNMTIYKCELQISGLYREKYLYRHENHMFALKSLTNTDNKLRVGTKNRVGRVSGNK